MADIDAEPTEPTVTRNDEAGRYEIHVGGELAGFTEFSPDAQGRLRFPHTLVDPAFRGRGLAGILVRDAVADVARRGETIIPLCPVVVSYVRDNDIPGLIVEWPARRETPQ